MKRISVVLSIACILIAIPATIFLVGQKQELRKKAAPATTLAVTPAGISKNVGDMFSLDITIDTGENQVVVTEIHVVYDPTKLEAQSITNSALFPNILASGVVERGSASITVGATDVKKPIKGTGLVAVIRFKALEKTETPILVRLAQNTFVGGLGEHATNVLVGSTPASITITGENTAAVSVQTGTVTPSLATAPTAIPTQPKSIPATITIATPVSGSAATTGTPTIRGEAAPGATVTITIYSTPRTVVVVADANGNWSYTPTTPLESGSHNVVASASDPSGKTQTAITTFIVAGGGGSVATPSATIIPTLQPIPISGTVETTIFLLAIGSLLLGLGINGTDSGMDKTIDPMKNPKHKFRIY